MEPLGLRPRGQQDCWSPWSPLASYDRRRHRNCFPTRKSASISEKVNISWSHRSVDALFTCVDLHVLVSRSINMLSVMDFVRKGIISGVRVQAGLHLDMLDADRSPNMQSAFLPELHRWISKLTARHLHACPPGDLLITMVKETVIFYKKEFRKMKKSRISPWSERDEARNDWEIACDCVKRANVVLHVRLCKEIFARKHTATHKPTSAQPLSAPHSDQRDTHTYIHTRINRLWSPLAYGLGGKNVLYSTCNSSRLFMIINYKDQHQSVLLGWKKARF